MFAAELGGKLPSGVRQLEDILTSYVFGFLRYSARSVYLSGFLNEVIGLEVTHDQARAAEFRFWPTLPDGTEPDVVVVVGAYYVLFEAKLFAPFDQGSEARLPQLVREAEGGKAEADREGKTFVLAAVTNDSCCTSERFVGLDGACTSIHWINWQRIAQIVLRVLEQQMHAAPDYEFARDLLALLDARHLRGYRGFHEIPLPMLPLQRGPLFLQADTMEYRGDFLGYPAALMRAAAPNSAPSTLFFKRGHFALESESGVGRPPEHVFFERS